MVEFFSQMSKEAPPVDNWEAAIKASPFFEEREGDGDSPLKKQGKVVVDRFMITGATIFSSSCCAATAVALLPEANRSHPYSIIFPCLLPILLHVIPSAVALRFFISEAKKLRSMVESGQDTQLEVSPDVPDVAETP